MWDSKGTSWFYRCTAWIYKEKGMMKNESWGLEYDEECGEEVVKQASRTWWGGWLDDSEHKENKVRCKNMKMRTRALAGFTAGYNWEEQQSGRDWWKSWGFILQVDEMINGRSAGWENWWAGQELVSGARAGTTPIHRQMAFIVESSHALGHGFFFFDMLHGCSIFWRYCCGQWFCKYWYRYQM